MEEKKATKISLSTFFLIIAIIAIGVMGFFIYKLNSDKENANSKITELNSKINNLQSTIDNLNTIEKNTTSITTNTTNNNAKESSVNTNTNEIGKEIAEKLDDTKGNEIYKKAIFSKTFLSLLIENKDTLKNIKFSDEEIAILLVEIDKEKEKSNIFVNASNSTGFYVSAKLDAVQNLSQKYFGKKLNTEKLNVQNGDKITVEVPSGFGIIVDKFVAGYKMENGDYFLTLEQIDEESTGSLTYGLFIKYDETTESITYKGFTSDIISYVSKFNSNKNN